MIGLDISTRLAAVRGEIAGVPRPWSHDIAIVAVTKGFDEQVLVAALDAGCEQIGENYAQELLSKRATIERRRPEVHFIGRLQSNKVRQLVDLVDVWASLDRSSIIDVVARRSPGARVLIQVNATGETNKGGCPLDEVAELVARAHDAGLLVDGLMTVGPTGRPAEDARQAFRTTRALVDRLGLPTCSMGMTADMRVAVEEGSTEVRLGTSLFGPRPPPGRK